jgi:hypothetical protein
MLRSTNPFHTAAEVMKRITACSHPTYDIIPMPSATFSCKISHSDKPHISVGFIKRQEVANIFIHTAMTVRCNLEIS